MGNQIEKCCKHCMKLQTDQFSQQTRFMEVNGNFNKPLRCRKFYISSQSLQKQKINELLIFTDASLTMSIPNFNLRLKEEQIQKLQQAIKYEIKNNNLTIKENCFVLNAIQEQIDSQYDQFKQFPSSKSQIQSEKEQKEKNIANQNQTVNKEKLKNQIEQFALRNKSRAFRFKNPLKKYKIGQIIVAIVPIFQKTQDLNALKQAVQQGLSMSEDLKSVGVSQISFMLGYEQTVFQKIILEYILGYSRSRKQYVFKRMNEFVYLTRTQQQINNFFNFLNIYTKNKLQKIDSVETLRSEKQRWNIRKLGSNTAKRPQIFQNKNDKGNIKKIEVSAIPINENTPIFQRTDPANQNESFGNTSFHSYQGTNLIGFDRERANNISQSNINLSRRSFVNDFRNNLNDISEIGSKNSDTPQIKNIRIKSFKSKESNVSDYF